MLALPYAILVFDFLLQVTSLAALKQMPVIALLFLMALYLLMCLKRKQGFYFLRFILPCVLLLMIVALLESNRIKYSHIPEYMLLFGLVFTVNVNQQRQSTIYFGCFLITVLLGVFDEVHHGIHPDRYYGWKDMVINAVGAFMGLLLALQLRPVKDNFLMNVSRIIYSYKYSAGILCLNLMIVFFSCLKLFSVQATGMFFVAYPQEILVLNFLSIIVSSSYCVFQFQRSKSNDEYSVLLYQPLIITSIIQVFIAYAYLQKLAFK